MSCISKEICFVFQLDVFDEPPDHACMSCISEEIAFVFQLDVFNEASGHGCMSKEIFFFLVFQLDVTNEAPAKNAAKKLSCAHPH